MIDPDQPDAPVSPPPAAQPAPIEPAPIEPTPAEPAKDRSTIAEAARNFAPDFLQEMFANPLDAGYFDAADRRARVGPPRGAARKAGFAIRMIALVATGLLLAIAYQQTVAAKPEQNKVQVGLVGDVRARQASTDTLERQANTLRAEVTKLRNASLDSTAVRQLTSLEAQTGLGPVRGGGIVVSMADGPPPVNPVTNQPQGDYLGRVQDLDLQTVVNELWRDGAEAISINDQRITATSAIRLAGNAILVDFVPLSQPYQVSAIGPGDLAANLRDSPTGALYERYISSYGMHFTIAERDNLSLPAAADPQLRYATNGSPAATTTPGSGSPSPSGGH
jgi:uncharacterized protein YlxW (UPF0749 family)